MVDQHNILFDSAISKINFEITDGAYNTNPEGWSLNADHASHSRIFYFESGEAVLEYSSKSIVLRPGNVYIIPRGLNFKGYSQKPHSKLYFFFKVSLPDGSDPFIGIGDIISLTVGFEEIARVKSLYFSKSIVDTLRLKSTIFSHAVSTVHEHITQTLSPVVYSPEIQQVVDYISKNTSIQLSVKFLSTKFEIPATTLSKHFSHEVGVNIGKYIDNIVFDNAKRMLASGNYSIQEISEKLGFCDRFYFSRRFKSKFGITPHKYRKIKTTTFAN